MVQPVPVFFVPQLPLHFLCFEKGAWIPEKQRHIPVNPFPFAVVPVESPFKPGPEGLPVQLQGLPCPRVLPFRVQHLFQLVMELRVEFYVVPFQENLLLPGAGRQECPDKSVFPVHHFKPPGIVGGCRQVVPPVPVVCLVHIHDTACQTDGLVFEAVVLVCGPRCVVEPDSAALQEALPVNSPPVVIVRLHQLRMIHGVQHPIVQPLLVRPEGFHQETVRALPVPHKYPEITLYPVQAVFLRPAVQFPEHGRLHAVIRFHNPHVFPRCQGQPPVHAVSVTGVFLVNDPHPGIPFRILPQYFRRPVRGAVIDTDDFNLPHGLSQDAFHAFPQVVLDIVYWYYNGYSCHFSPCFLHFLKFSSKFFLMKLR